MYNFFFYRIISELYTKVMGKLQKMLRQSGQLMPFQPRVASIIMRLK